MTVGPSFSRSRKPTAYMVEVFPVRSSVVESIKVSQMQILLQVSAPTLA